MAVHSRQDEDAGDHDVTDEEPRVRACETRPGRTVFTEDDNSDAWIATDLTVEVER